MLVAGWILLAFGILGSLFYGIKYQDRGGKPFYIPALITFGWLAFWARPNGIFNGTMAQGFEWHFRLTVFGPIYLVYCVVIGLTAFALRNGESPEVSRLQDIEYKKGYAARRFAVALLGGADANWYWGTVICFNLLFLLSAVFFQASLEMRGMQQRWEWERQLERDRGDLTPMLDDVDPETRYKAAIKLAPLDAGLAVESKIARVLDEVLKTGSTGKKAASIVGMKTLATQRTFVVESFRAALKDSDAAVRSDVVEALIGLPAEARTGGCVTLNMSHGVSPFDLKDVEATLGYDADISVEHVSNVGTYS